jgi:hypothetical protein
VNPAVAATTGRIQPNLRQTYNCKKSKGLHDSTEHGTLIAALGERMSY